MSPFDGGFRRRLGLLLGVLGLAVAACLALAVMVAREANRTIGRMADVELESAVLARQFRTAVDDLHGALLRLGTDQAEDGLALIRNRRLRLSRWVTDRLAAARNEPERRVLQALDGELRGYFRKLDSLVAAPLPPGERLDRETVVDFDDAAIRLQGLADDFDAVHDTGERELLQASLALVRELRNLIFVCLALLLAAAGVLAALLYRNVVRPLRTKLVERETLLAQREKLAALGTLAAGVAHEIRNPLTAIKARLYTLRRTTPAPEAADDVRAISREIDRLEGIVRDVLGYARPMEPKFAEVDLAAWVREFGAFVEPELTAGGIRLTVVAPEPLRLPADAGQLRQVMLNLVRNAREALDGRPGRIELAVRRERGTLRQQRLAEMAVLSVTDDGPGIPAAVRARLFDPFFTTKAAGTGLGLAIIARLVENHGGEITYQTAEGRGTCFAVRLPVHRTAD
ncbi:MAG TPA: ATP-binding protein [Opitutaceae bacterium]|nr:ATP-binding protein [Opitutaceae bacterium]